MCHGDCALSPYLRTSFGLGVKFFPNGISCLARIHFFGNELNRVPLEGGVILVHCVRLVHYTETNARRVVDH